MKYLPDTHIFLWWITDNSKLSDHVRKVITNPDNEIFLSSASTWEMVIKSSIGKLSLPPSPDLFIRKQTALNEIKILNVTIEHTFAVLKLPMIHKDPFDRILIAQAITEDLILITDDLLIKKYAVTVFEN
ncbi:MAG: twitching motility protein PilT [Desulfobacteraceae bacterium IS3]|nr:MAG: twitching motility protein PilT [Desulfobacteraceae bacterium IS3]